MIDDLELSQVQEIATVDRRALAEHKPPGMDGSLLQDLGRSSTSVVLRGVATGEGALRFVEQLDGKFRAGAPVPFSADIVADAAIDKMVIEDVAVDELAGKPQRFAYLVSLREHVEPVEPEDTSGLDAGILDDATNLVNGIADSLDLSADLVAGFERFVSGLGDLLERLQGFRRRIEDARGG
jgi:hypothetical protein